MSEGLEAAEYEVMGVSLSGPPPIGRLHLQLTKGLSVLYGLNGVGKTRILSAVRAALSGYSGENCDAVVHMRFEEIYFYPETAFSTAIIATMQQTLTSSALSSREVDKEGNIAVDVPTTVGELAHALLEASGRSWGRWEELTGEAAANGFLSLRAIGTTVPRWEVWVSDTRRDDSPLEQAYESSRTLHRYLKPLRQRAGAEGLDSLEIERVPTVVLDLVEAGAGLLERVDLDFAHDSYHLRPRWAPVEILRVGTLEIGPVLLVQPDVEGREIDALTRALLADLGGLEGSGVQGPEIVAVLAPALGDLKAKATRNLAALMAGSLELAIALGQPADWFRGILPRWVLRDEYGAEAPLAALSAARRRWATAAVQLALLEENVDRRPALLMVDEPEAGLHRKAEARLAAGLDELSHEGTGGGLIATHSPAFLTLPVRRVRVGRDFGGTINVEDFDGLPADDDLGLTKSDLLASTRVFVIVEGEHDEIVLNTLFDADLRRAQSRLLPLRGGKKAWSVAHPEWLLEMSDAPLLVILDALPEQTVSRHWLEAQRLAAAGNVEGAKGVLDELKDMNKAEGGFLSSLGREAMSLGVFERVHAAGLSRDDILRYLPGGDDLYLRKKQGKLSPHEVKEAALQLDEIPEDLLALLERIKVLAGS